MAKYQKYAEYKDSGVEWLGKIPSDWKVVKLSYKLKLLSGDGITAFDIEDTGTYPVFGGNGLRGFTEQYNCDGEYALIGRQGALCGNINVARGKFFATEHAVVVYPYETFNLTFLSEFLRFMDLGQYSVSAAQPGIAVDRINTLPIVIPTLGEQNAIGAFLDHETAKIDSLIAKQEKLIELLKEKRQAVISHAVTKGLNPDVAMKDSGVEWLGQVPEHWTVSKLKHFVNVVDCKHITAEFFDEGIPLASIGEVKGWKVNLSNAKLTNEKYYQELIDGNRKPQVGDIIYTRNATVGEASLVHTELPKFALGQDVCLIHIIQKLSSEYLLHFLKSEIIKIQLNSAMVGSTFKRINVDDIRNYVIVIPPIEEQECILKDLDQKIEKYDSLINFAVKQIQLMQERRTALISSAVTGKIDVRNWQHPNYNNNEANTELGA